MSTETPPPLPGVPGRPVRPPVPLGATCLVWLIGAAMLAVLCSGGVALGVAHSVAPTIAAARVRRAEAERERERGDDVRSLFEVVAARLLATARATGELPDTLDESPPKDPWHHAIRYERSGPERAVLRSAGPDGQFGTRDDLERVIELP
jgi:hypothetical protein